MASISKNIFRKFAIAIIFVSLFGVSNSAIGTERIIAKMQLINANTFRHGSNTITLWGITPIQPKNSIYYLRGRDLLERISKRELNCKVVGGKIPSLIARCISDDDLDLGLELVNKGLAIVDRENIVSSEFSEIYIGAENGARDNGQGVWEKVREKENKGLLGLVEERLPEEITVWDLLALPMGLMLLVVLIMGLWVRRAVNTQKIEIEKIKYKELMLQAREKHILITLLKGELEENKDKIFAFLTIYKDMLSTIADISKTPEYKSTGEPIQKHPFFSKDIFEMNLGKLPVLDLRLANNISDLYSALPGKHEYIDLDVDISREDVIETLDGIIEDAEKWVERIDEVTDVLENASEEFSSIDDE